ncbi:universal stress protein [Streptomyces aureus]|uniref:universal stress protein n=1 Tax=Streptomyces aureus TaxID=193461 RepID=UPI00056578DF|nr:universal stress protein [Streptomyces aureus]
MLRPVVVGLDGSRESLAAADWAAREALRRGAPLRLVHAWEAMPAEPSTLPELDAPRYWARRILREAVDRLDERYPRLYLSSEQLSLPPVEALVAAAEEAELLVLGNRALGGVGGFLAGSVALATVARLTRPAVLVRADETSGSAREAVTDGDATGRRPHREVVVGLDPDHRCTDVLAFAFESAALRSAPLRMVHAWRPPGALGPGAEDLTGQEDAEQAVASTLKRWGDRFPGVEVLAQVRNGRPADLLLHAARDACLLVVGRRIRPARLGAHTGPVTHAVLHHVPCPVAVVPHE